MDLLTEINRYIKHKVILARTSAHYLHIPRLQALQYADSLRQLFCSQRQYLTQQDVARYILQNKQHLLAILPAEQNHSYQSQYQKINEIITAAQKLLKKNDLHNLSMGAVCRYRRHHYRHSKSQPDKR